MLSSYELEPDTVNIFPLCQHCVSVSGCGGEGDTVTRYDTVRFLVTVSGETPSLIALEVP
jgi:hypothetical protein